MGAPAILPPTVHLQLSTLCSIPGWLLQLYVFPYLSSFEVMYVNSSFFALGFSDAKAYSWHINAYSSAAQGFVADAANMVVRTSKGV